MNTSPRGEPPLSHTIGHIAGVLSHAQFPTGDRALLRRMRPGQTPPLVFYRFALTHLPLGWDQGDASRRDWTVLVAGMAIMAPDIHRFDVRLGTVLALTGFSESRLDRLFTSCGDTKRLLILHLSQFLRFHHATANWLEIAQLLLTRDPERSEAIRRQTAQAFYSTPCGPT